MIVALRVKQEGPVDVPMGGEARAELVDQVLNAELGSMQAPKLAASGDMSTGVDGEKDDAAKPPAVSAGCSGPIRYERYPHAWRAVGACRARFRLFSIILAWE